MLPPILRRSSDPDAPMRRGGMGRCPGVPPAGQAAAGFGDVEDALRSAPIAAAEGDRR